MRVGSGTNLQFFLYHLFFLQANRPLALQHPPEHSGLTLANLGSSTSLAALAFGDTGVAPGSWLPLGLPSAAAWAAASALANRIRDVL